MVLGSVNVDLVMTVPRLPSPGETVVGGRFARHAGGKGANQAVAAARLGAHVVFVGAVGDDEEGRRCRHELVAEGIEVSPLATVAAPTGVAAILVDEAGENLIAVASGANDLLDATAVDVAFAALPDGPAVVLASLEVPLAAVERAAQVAQQRGWRLVLNPAPARPLPPTLLEACEVIVPNAGEAEALGGLEALMAAGAGAVVVTLGAGGASLHRPGMETVRRPAPAVEVIDTTGAGDAFNGTLAWALASGWPIEAGLEAAVAAGGLSTRGSGARARLATRGELEELLADRVSRVDGG
ncbi:MAG: ribokinase [Chloroflexi bacterium]|nr:ribokinase [Chloroflexota bacterium]